MSKQSRLSVWKCHLFTMILGMLLLCFGTAMAASSGTCGDNVIWTLDDNGLLTISGTGDMWSYQQYETIPWRESVVKAIISPGVTSIGWRVFSGCTHLMDVTIPDSVTEICDYAFSSCTHLTAITIPDNVTYIADNSFLICPAIRYASIGSGGAKALSGAGYSFRVSGANYGLKYEFSDGMITDLSIVEADQDISSITIPDFVTRIGDAAFSGCSSLTGITIPDSVTGIGASAFANCSSLMSLRIPDSLISIGTDVFSDCPAIMYAATGSEGAKTISKAGYTFRVSGNKCNLQYYFNSSGESTDLMVVSADAEATELIIPFEATGFEYEWQEGWDYVGAFSNCINLISITMNTNIVEIDFPRLFEKCGKLEFVIFPSDHSAYSSKEGVVFNKNENAFIYFPNGKHGGYVIPGSITNIDSGIFKNHTGLTEITIPNNVTGMADDAFSGCANLKKVTMEARISEIPFETIFDGCNSLETVKIPSDHHTYYSRDGVVFSKNKTNLVYCPRGKEGEYSIPDGTTTIESTGFTGCTKLTKVTIPEGVVNISSAIFSINHNGAFSRCTGLTEVIIPDSVKLIGLNAFYGCTELRQITTTAKLSNHAFEGCTSLEEVTLSDEVGGEAFADCSQLKTVKLRKGVKYLGDKAFSGCTALESVKLTQYITWIGNDAFEKSTLIIAPVGSYAAQWAYDHYYELQTYEPERSITITNDGHGTGVADPESGPEGTEVTLTAIPNEGYQLNEWVVISGGITISDNKFIIGASEIEIRATFKPADTITVNNGVYDLDHEKMTATFVKAVKSSSNTQRILSSFAGSETNASNITTLKINATVTAAGKKYKVTAIANNACKGMKKLTSVTIGAQVTAIGKSAFSNCTALKTVKGGAKVKTIGANAFASCKNLVSIATLKKITQIGAGAFAGCAKLTTVPVLGSLQSIGDNAFKGCKQLFKITLSAKVKSIGKNAFNGCAKLKTIVIKTKLLKSSSVGVNAFKGIYSKPTVTCPKGMAKNYKTLLLKKGMPKKAVFK